MDNSKVEQLYLNYKDQIYNFILRLVNDPEIAKDITQQTFLKLMCESNDFILTRSQILQVSRNLLYNELNSINEFSIEHLDEGNNYCSEDDRFSAIPISRALKKLRYKINLSIATLSIRSRELMILYFIENISIVEIALITKRSVVDVKVNLHDARIIFEKILIKNMNGMVTEYDTQCEIYKKIINSNQEFEFSDNALLVINHHISNCSICINSNEQLKRTGILLNLTPLYTAPLILDELMSKVINLGVKL